MKNVSLDHAAGLVRRWRTAVDTAGRARATAVQAERELLDLLGDADVGTLDGTPAVRRDVEARDGIDLTRLREDHPELWEQYPATRTRTQLKRPRRARKTPGHSTATPGLNEEETL